MVTKMVTKLSDKKQLLATIALRASSPPERLQQLPNEPCGEASEHDGQAHLQRLYRLVGATDEETKACFLAQLHLNEAQIIHALSLPVLEEETIWSAWVLELEQIMSKYMLQAWQEKISLDRSLVQGAPMPFEELLVPFVQYAREQVITIIPLQSQLLSTEAQVALERWLLSQLTYLAGQALELEFAQFRMLHGSSSEEYVDEKSTRERFLYDSFLRQHDAEHFLRFFAEYSLLARLLIQCIDQWIEVCTEFIERLATDYAEIGLYFYQSQRPGKVVKILPACSDPHYSGRSVFILTFAEGGRLVYKPRCMDIDSAFFTCVQWFNGRGIFPDLKCAKLLTQGAYGWMEYIEHRPCKTRAEVHSYYQRAGVLLCLLYVLGATDVHFENIITNGAYPVVIDLETIVSPSTPFWESSTATDPSSQKQNAYSVLRSGMVGLKLKFLDRYVDMSGLGDADIFVSSLPNLYWEYINTDAMTFSYKTMSVKMTGKNKVILEGACIKSKDFSADLITGFRGMYRFLMTHRPQLLAKESIFDLFTSCPIRFVFRPSHTYARQLKRLIHPDFFRDGAERWIDLQIFKKTWSKKQMDTRLWMMAEAELNALERLDIPWFGTRPESTCLLTDEGRIIENTFHHSALVGIRSCLASLCEEDLEQQILSIHDALTSTKP